MSGALWTKGELKKLSQEYNKKPEWKTDFRLALELSRTMGKSPEAIRWKLRQFHQEEPVTFPKILLLDIETLPVNADIWDVWNQNISPNQLRKDWSIVCWAAKWLFDTKVVGASVTPEEAVNRQDASVMEPIWNMINEAHMVITYNGNNFDLKRLNWRFLVNGLPRPMFYKSIDLYKVIGDSFAPTYKKMDYVNKILGIGRKIDTSFKWWQECADGSRKYLKLMLDYNKQDVNITEELYLRIRPWILSHPNMNLFNVTTNKVPCCPNCSDYDLHWDGTYQTALGLYRAFRCEKCGAIGRSTQKKYQVKASGVQ